MSCAAAAVIAWPVAANWCAKAIGLGVGRDGAFAEYVALPMTNVWHHWPGIDEEVAAIFDPFGNAVHTALAFPVLGEDVLVSGAGPIGLMATAAARHAGARHVVVSEPNAYRRELASKMGATLTIDPRERPLESTFAELDMVEGFDVALEMSGNATALRTAISNMAHGGGVAILGLPTAEIPLDVNEIIFNQLTPARDLRPGDVRDLVQDGRAGPVGARHLPRDHAPVRVPRVRGRVRRGPLRRLRQGDHGLGRCGMTTPAGAGNDPLAFIADELEELRAQHLYRPLRIMSAAQGPVTVVDGREVISLSSNDYLGPGEPSAAPGRGIASRRRVRCRLRRRAHDRRDDDPP